MKTEAKQRVLMVLLSLSVSLCVHATQINILHVGDSDTLNGAVFSGTSKHVGGTGVFEPFLSLRDPGGSVGIERAYNAGNGHLYLDNQRPTWNSQLRLSDLQYVSIGSTEYYVFALDANEPGNGKSFISIDNIRIYTSASDTSATVQDDESKLNQLGILRFSLNDPLKNASGAYIMDNWVRLDSRLYNGPAGSGLYDLLVYIPKSAFAGASSADYLWFYNLNGAHEAAEKELAAESGFEEWRALKGPNPPLPDGGATLALLGVGMLGLGALARRIRQ